MATSSRDEDRNASAVAGFYIGSCMMRVGIVGAGMAGLSCAAVLRRQNYQLTLFDKGRGPGGRMSTRRVSTSLGDASFDHGAQYFTARDPAFAAQVEAWRATGVAARWPAAGAGAWVGTPAMSSPVRALSTGLDVRWGTRVMRLEPGRDCGWWLHGESMAPELFDAVVIAVPAEQVSELIEVYQPAFAAQARAERSMPSWTMMAAFAEPLPVGPDCLRDKAIIGWAARNSAKPGRTGPETWVVQATPEWSTTHLEDDATRVAETLLAALAEAINAKLPAALGLAAHRWRYARSSGSAAVMLWDGDRRIGLCGDWLIGPRVESAWLSGFHLATAIIAGEFALQDT